jgi:hypothetical protein
MKLMHGKNKALSVRQEVIAVKVAGRIVRVQRRLADYLNHRTAALRPKTWLLLLTAFCGAFGSYLVYLLVQVCY